MPVVVCWSHARKLAFLTESNVLRCISRQLPGSSPPRLHLFRRDIATLNPSNLQSTDFIIVPEFGSFSLPITVDGAVQRIPLTPPPKSRGFLYFRPGPPHARIAGELRLRVTADNDPQGFEDGHDFIEETTTLHWSLPLTKLITSTRWRAIVDLLRKEYGDLIPAPSVLRAAPSPQAIVLHSARQPIFVDMSWPRLHFLGSDQDRLFSAKVRLPRGHTRGPQYRGSFVGHLEPRTTDQKERCYVVHVDRIIERIVPTNSSCEARAPPPTAGQVWKSAAGVPWTIDMDLQRLHSESQPSDPHAIASLHDMLRGERDQPSKNGIADSDQDGTVTHMDHGRIDGPTFIVHDLDPKHLDREDWIDLSGVTLGNLKIRYPTKHNDEVRLSNQGLNFRYTTSEPSYFNAVHGGYVNTPVQDALCDTATTPFPPNTRGFFYFHLKDPLHPIGAVLRFRITESADLASFERGRDLCLPSTSEEHIPWSFSIPQHISDKGPNDEFTHWLADAGLLRGADADLWASPATGENTSKESVASIVRPTSEPVVFEGTPFIVDLSKLYVSHHIGFGSRSAHFQWWHPRIVQNGVETAAYSGRLRVHIQAVPEIESYAYRVLQVLEPVSPTIPGSPVHTFSPKANDLVSLTLTSDITKADSIGVAMWKGMKHIKEAEASYRASQEEGKVKAFPEARKTIGKLEQEVLERRWFVDVAGERPIPQGRD